MAERLPRRILLAEDNATNQKLALRLLERLGYRADVAANGVEVLTALRRLPYDVVLMDVQMPEMDGLEATRAITREWPADARPYIIAMTANATARDREEGLAAGMDDYVTKPIRVEELISALGKSRARAPMPGAAEPSQTGAARPEEAPIASSAALPPTEPPASAPAAPPLDAAWLARLRRTVGDDPAVLAELIDTFLSDAPRLLVDLRRSLEQGDAAGVRLAAHSLKSNGAEFGAAAFADLCKQLESAAKAGTLEGAENLLAQAQAEFERVKAFLIDARAQIA
jgi:CheY-like chemotaxis protein